MRVPSHGHPHLPLPRNTTYKFSGKNSMLDYFPFQGFIAPLYVVEITVFPWRNQQERKTEKGHLHLDLHPVYEDEEGKCYFRRQASLVQVLYGPLFNLYKGSLQVNPPFVPKME